MILGMTPFYDGTQDQVSTYVSFDIEFVKKTHSLRFLSFATRTDGAFQEHHKV